MSASRKIAAAPFRLWVAVVLVAALFITGAATAEQPESKPKSLLILPFDLVDTSLQAEINHGPLDSDLARLQRTEQIVRRAMDDLPEFRVVDNQAVAEHIDDAQGTYRYLYRCNSCEVDIGRAAGAQLVMTGWVQKVSNLILNVNATIRRTDTGQEVGGASVDMRNDTDAAWRAAALYLVEHPLLSSYRTGGGAKSEAGQPTEQPGRIPINRYPG